MQNLGNLSTLRLEEETTYGGGITSLNASLIEFISSTLSETMTPLDDPSLLGTRSYHSWKRGSVAVGGDVSINLKTRNMGYFFKHLMGKYKQAATPSNTEEWTGESLPNPTITSLGTWEPLCKLRLQFSNAPNAGETSTITVTGTTGRNGEYDIEETMEVTDSYNPTEYVETEYYYYSISSVTISGNVGVSEVWPDPTTVDGYSYDGLYTHQFLLSEELPYGMNLDPTDTEYGKDGTELGDAVTSLVFEVNKGGNYAWEYKGCKIDAATISIAAPELINTSFSIVGQQASTGSPVASPAPARVNNELFAFHQVTVKQDTVALDPQPLSVDVTVNNGLRTDKYVLGSDVIEATYPNAIREVTGTIHKQFANNINGEDPMKWWDVFKAEQYLDFRLDMFNYGYGVPTESFTIKLPRVRIEAGDLDVGGPEELEHDIPFRALRDTDGSAEIEISMKNTDSGYPAPSA